MKKGFVVKTDRGFYLSARSGEGLTRYLNEAKVYALRSAAVRSAGQVSSRICNGAVVGVMPVYLYWC